MCQTSLGEGKVLVRSMKLSTRREPAMIEVFEVGVEHEVRFCHRGTKGCGSGHFVQEESL